MSGVSLVDLNIPDLCDVLHFMFEDDLRVSTEDEAKIVDKSRVRLYKDLYNVTYEYARDDQEDWGPPLEHSDLDDDDNSDVQPFQTKKEPTKRYITPTQFNQNAANPYYGVLDPPLT